MAQKDVRGRAGEDRAAAHLVGLGWRVLERNWRCPIGEIDIVAHDGRHLVVVEVKTRRNAAFGHPLEAITADKLRRLRRLALAWTHAHPARTSAPLRLDAIAITGEDPATASLEHVVGLR